MGTLFGDIVLADSEADIDSLLWSKDMHADEKDAKEDFDKPDETEDDAEEDEDMDELTQETGEEEAQTEDKVEGGADAEDKDCEEGDDKCTMEGTGDAGTHDEL